MTLKRVVMRLARNPGHPEGDLHQGYVLVAPLDVDSKLDASEWRAKRAACTVARFRPGQPHEADGWLSHHGSHWYFRYDEEEEGPAEPVFRLGEHRLELGDYVTIHERDGQDLTYRVTEHLPFADPAAQRTAASHS